MKNQCGLCESERSRKQILFRRVACRYPALLWFPLQTVAVTKGHPVIARKMILVSPFVILFRFFPMGISQCSKMLCCLVRSPVVNFRGLSYPCFGAALVYSLLRRHPICSFRWLAAIWYDGKSDCGRSLFPASPCASTLLSIAGDHLPSPAIFLFFWGQYLVWQNKFSLSLLPCYKKSGSLRVAATWHRISHAKSQIFLSLFVVVPADDCCCTPACFCR